jgi:hypothetical protein
LQIFEGFPACRGITSISRRNKAPAKIERKI